MAASGITEINLVEAGLEATKNRSGSSFVRLKADTNRYSCAIAEISSQGSFSESATIQGIFWELFSEIIVSAPGPTVVQ